MVGPMGELGVLFNPGMRHEQEEKLAKQMLREDEGTGRKGRRSIDLESGVVVIDADSAPSAGQSSHRPSSAQSSSAQPSDNSADVQPVRDEPAAGPSTPPAASDGAPRAARRTRSATAQHGMAAAPSGKARRRSETGSATDSPTGKSRRRGR